MKTRTIGTLILAVLVAGAVAGAYKLNGPKWATQQVPYYVNPANPFMSQSEALASIQAGVSAWSQQSNANVLPYYMGQTSATSVSKNGRTEIFFRNGSNGSLYGETYWWYDGSYNLIEADTVFYSTYPFYPGAAGCSSGLYLQDATAHEFGHSLGLGHSAVASATMYPTLGWCSTANRVLDADDLAGIEALYPAGGGTSPANTAPAVAISSPASGASFASGASITFSGSATDKESGNLSAGLAWSSSVDGQLGTGASVTRVLSGGTHTITAKAVDPSGASGQSQITVTVAATAAPPSTGGITLSGRGYKVKGAQKADLKWTGASATAVDIYRDGARITTVSNGGAYTDPINRKGGGQYQYKVCNTGTTTCSNPLTISF